MEGEAYSASLVFARIAMRMSPRNHITILRQVRIVFMDLIDLTDASLHQRRKLVETRVSPQELRWILVQLHNLVDVFWVWRLIRTVAYWSNDVNSKPRSLQCFCTPGMVDCRYQATCPAVSSIEGDNKHD